MSPLIRTTNPDNSSKLAHPAEQRSSLRLRQALFSALARSSPVEEASPADTSYLLEVGRNILDSVGHNSGHIDRTLAAAGPIVLVAAIDLGCRDRHHSAVLVVVTSGSLVVDLPGRHIYSGRPSQR